MKIGFTMLRVSILSSCPFLTSFYTEFNWHCSNEPHTKAHLLHWADQHALVGQNTTHFGILWGWTRLRSFQVNLPVGQLCCFFRQKKPCNGFSHTFFVPKKVVVLAKSTAGSLPPSTVADLWFTRIFRRSSLHGQILPTIPEGER